MRCTVQHHDSPLPIGQKRVRSRRGARRHPSSFDSRRLGPDVAPRLRGSGRGRPLPSRGGAEGQLLSLLPDEGRPGPGGAGAPVECDPAAGLRTSSRSRLSGAGPPAPAGGPQRCAAPPGSGRAPGAWAVPSAVSVRRWRSRTTAFGPPCSPFSMPSAAISSAGWMRPRRRRQNRAGGQPRASAPNPGHSRGSPAVEPGGARPRGIPGRLRGGSGHRRPAAIGGQARPGHCPRVALTLA